MREHAQDRLEKTEKKLADARELAKENAERLERADTLRRKLKERAEELKLDAGREGREAAFERENILALWSREKRQMEDATREAEYAEREAKTLREAAAALQIEMLESLRAVYIPQDNTGRCSLCGQALPEEMAAREAEEKKADFEESMKRKEAELAARKAEVERRLANTDFQASEARRRAAEGNKKTAGFEQRANELKTVMEREAVVPDLNLDKEYRETARLLAEQEEGGRAEERQIKTEELLDMKRKLADEIFEMEKKLALRAQIEAAQIRMGELSLEKERLVFETDSKERMVCDLERFTAYKCALMEKKVNSMFSNARWRLFDLQINGGISECCECLIGGVPYADANSAARINAGLEIIDVFSRMNGAEAPVFIDNRESIGELFPVNTQLVSLFVTGDKTLRAEPADENKPRERE